MVPMIRLSAIAALGLLCLAGLGGCQSTGSGPTRNAHALTEPKELLKIADAARRDGDFSGAASLYQRAIDAGADPYTAHLGLADSLAGLGQYDKAIAECRQAAALDKTKADPEVGIGRIALAQHRAAEALSAFEAALALNPGLPAAWNGKGVALDLLGRHGDAQLAYRTGLGSAPDDRVLRNNYGLSLALSGHYQQAVEVLSALAQEQGASSRNRQNLALALGLQGDKRDARAVAKTDLDEAEVESNLRFYDEVRRLPVGDAPAAPPAPPPSSGSN